MSNTNLFHLKEEFPPFPGRIDKECKLILDAMMGFPVGTMMNNVVHNIFSQLDSGMLTGIVLSKNFHLLKKLGAVAPANLNRNGQLPVDIDAESQNSSKLQKFIIINSLYYKGQKNAKIKYEPNNQDWRTTIAHEMTHIINDCDLFFPSTKDANGTYFVELTEAFKLSKNYNEGIWQLFVHVCGELASRFTSWYLWEELFKKNDSDVTLPSPILFFHRACYMVFKHFATSKRNELGDYIPIYYDPYTYLRYLQSQFKVSDLLLFKGLTQVCIFMEQIGLHCHFFDANLTSRIQVNKFFVDSASRFRKDVRVWDRSLTPFIYEGFGLH